MPIINLSLCLRVRVRGHVPRHLDRPVISCRLSFQGCVLFLLVLGWARVLSAPITNSDAGQQLTARPTVRSHFSRRSNVTLTRGIHRQQLFIFHLIWAAQFQQSLQLLYFLFIIFFLYDLTPAGWSPTDITQAKNNGECPHLTFVSVWHPAVQNQTGNSVTPLCGLTVDRSWTSCAEGRWSNWAAASLRIFFLSFFFSSQLKHQTVIAEMDVARHH